MIAFLQAMAGIAWAIVAIIMFRPAVDLVFFGRVSERNARAVLIAFHALTQVGFSVRWWLFDHTVPMMGTTETSMWAALYLLSAVAAVAVIAFARSGAFGK